MSFAVAHRSLLVLGLTALCSAYNQAPRVFVDVEAISMIDPLQHGFNIILHRSFAEHYLKATRLPTIYVTTVPLGRSEDQRSEQTSQNKVLYREDVPNEIINVKGLQETSWYYVCVEIENVVRPHSRSNSTTDCRLARTLDRFGRRADEIVTDIRISAITPTSMEFQLTVDANFSIQVTAYLSGGSSPAQSYILSQSKSIRVTFPLLSPGFNYGKLCVLEQPLEPYYTMLGRSIQIFSRKCHFDTLQTKSRDIITSDFGQRQTGENDVFGPPHAIAGRLKSSAISHSSSQLMFLILTTFIFLVTVTP